ncbi:hypothetical protein BDY21DRAFT_351747 [Lineolata rhizophorae]|uniref:Uncharacterized protein n=1 Tax=Lineolata rhizophorae TaxID=578093 RepID=A0A6A6NUA0_9PEZI|nr:hypothetical protein BDY21DRAFT_351747 [Lineolata rhizophorae]
MHFAGLSHSFFRALKLLQQNAARRERHSPRLPCACCIPRRLQCCTRVYLCPCTRHSPPTESTFAFGAFQSSCNEALQIYAVVAAQLFQTTTVTFIRQIQRVDKRLGRYSTLLIQRKALSPRRDSLETSVHNSPKKVSASVGCRALVNALNRVVFE